MHGVAAVSRIQKMIVIIENSLQLHGAAIKTCIFFGQGHLGPNHVLGLMAVVRMGFAHIEERTGE
jgi:hypothetical protein